MSFKKVVSFLLAGSSLMLVTCKSADIEKRKNADLERLVSWMTGSFSSQHQAEVDSNFFDIRLHMVQIWPDRTDGKWLYVEQAVANTLEKPYRQRIYRLTQIDDVTFQCTTYSFNNPSRFTGEWKKFAPMAQMTPDSLSAKEGCSIILKKHDEEAFIGSTPGKECVDKFLGASYATSEVIIRKNELTSWDRGYNENDEQVWGSTQGGYIFRKIEELQ